MRSFEVDHTTLLPGIYKHSSSGFVDTWDIRMKKPNNGDYLSPAAIHTIEHTMATYLRERYGNYRIVGIFPMGCQTGFYVLTRFIDKRKIFEAIVDYIMNLQRLKVIPGATEKQCGQYELQSLEGAKRVTLEYYSKWLKYQDSAENY